MKKERNREEKERKNETTLDNEINETQHNSI